MYFYFYDTCTQQPTHASLLHEIEARLVELGINGRIEKLSIFKNARDLIEDAIRKGAKTVVAVGNDSTFTQVVNIAAPYDVTVGFIPIEASPIYTPLLGVPIGIEAADILSKRRKVTIDIGNAGGNFFIRAIKINLPTQTRIVCNGQFSIASTSEENSTYIYNIAPEEMNQFSSPVDGVLDVVINEISAKKKKRFQQKSAFSTSVFHSSNIEVVSQNKKEEVACTLDDSVTVNTPFTISVEKEALDIIVGKERALFPEPSDQLEN